MSSTHTHACGRGRLKGATLVALSVLLAAVGCQEPPSVDQLQTTIDYRVAPPGEGQAVGQSLIDEIEAADTRVWAAVAGDTMTPELAEALAQARIAGVEVKVVADADDKGTAGFELLQKEGIPITWGDGPIRYLPNPTLAQIVGTCSKDDARETVTCTSGAGGTPCPDSLDGEDGAICRPGEFNRMSHRFVIIDKNTVWNLANGFGGANANGSAAAGTLAWRTESELIHEDFTREFRQMFGGVTADSLDEYNGPNKSTTDPHVDYFSNQGIVSLRFNPQERLMKHVIDAVYGARSSVRVVSQSLRNPFLLDALEYKKEHGFKVQVIVGKDTQPEGPARQRLKALGAEVHPAGTNLPTAVLVDTQRRTRQAKQWPREALVLSHPLWHAQPLKLKPPPPGAPADSANDSVVVYPSDHFVDGNMWRIFEYESSNGRAKVIGQLSTYYDRLAQQSEAM